MNRGEIKTILAARGLAPSRKRGQNFLASAGVARAIADAAGLSPDGTVIEFGPGLGALTMPLAAAAGRVIAFELDSGIVAWHQEKKILPENVELRHQDMLKADLAALAQETGGRLIIAANLPYSVSSPLLFKFLDNRDLVGRAVLMLQKEVAERLSAAPASRNYSILSVLFASSARIETVMRVGPENFHPRPKVDSAVVRIEFMTREEREEKLPPHEFRELARTVKAAFAQRRKTLVNCLKAAKLVHDRAAGEKLLSGLGLDPAVRAERLGVEDFVRLALALRREATDAVPAR